MLKKLVTFQEDSKVKHETIILSKNVQRTLLNLTQYRQQPHEQYFKYSMN